MKKSLKKNLSAVLFLPLAAALVVAPVTVAPPPAHAHGDIVQLAVDNRDAVVSVGGEFKQQKRQFQHPNFPDLPFDFFPRRDDKRPERRRREAYIGSGFIVDADGYILTNAHVVDELEEVEVQLANGDEYAAEVIGSDKLTDVALLKISAEEPLSAVKIGDSDALRVGEQVLAIGSPYGLEQSVTSGIVSALARDLPSENYVPFIQTDAAINPGNSGGPLININGEVVGINSQIISPVRAFAGVSFAIPINDAMDIQGRLREDGTVQRGRLGVYFRPVNEKDITPLNLQGEDGVVVQEVIPDSAAEEAGLESGDVLLEVNGTKIAKSNDLPRFIGRIKPGTEIDIGFVRGGETLTVAAVLGALESDEPGVFGLRLEEVPGPMRERAGIDGGALIAGIDYDDAPEDVEQLRPGDIVLGLIINGRSSQIGGKSELDELLREHGKSPLAFRIWRNGRRLLIPVNPSNPN